MQNKSALSTETLALSFHAIYYQLTFTSWVHCLQNALQQLVKFLPAPAKLVIKNMLKALRNLGRICGKKTRIFDLKYSVCLSFHRYYWVLLAISILFADFQYLWGFLIFLLTQKAFPPRNKWERAPLAANTNQITLHSDLGKYHCWVKCLNS